MPPKRRPAAKETGKMKRKSAAAKQNGKMKGESAAANDTGKGKGKMPAANNTGKGKGKRPTVEENVEAWKKAKFDRQISNAQELAQRFSVHFSDRTVIPGRNIDFSELGFFNFDQLFSKMGWLSIVSVREFVYPRVVRCFYCNMTFEEEGPITTTINGREIQFDIKNICEILQIPNDGLCIYGSNKWPRVDGFKPGEAVQRLCGYPNASRKSRPRSRDLTVLSRILQHMISFIFIPKGGHRDEVSFFEAFLVDCILTQRKINMAYIVFQHMKACSLIEGAVLPYGMFITKIMKFYDVNLRNESDREKLSSFDTYNIASLNRMKFEARPDGSWGRKSSKASVYKQVPSEQDVEEHNMDGGGPQNQNENELQKDKETIAEAVEEHPFHTGRKDGESLDLLTAQISSIATRLEEIAFANDARFTSLETRVERFEEEYKSGMELLSGRLSEMMTFLKGQFPANDAAQH